MPVLGITGGIATGKSTFTRNLRPRVLGEIFDADACARELLNSDQSVRAEVLNTFGRESIASSGRIDRIALRTRVFADAVERRKLESILHPIIRTRWLAGAAEARKSNRWLLVDIPLLFETQAEAHFDCVAVVACSLATQRQRLREVRGLSESLAEQIVSAQLELPLKAARADHLIWNDASPRLLDEQAALFAAWLQQQYG